MGSPIYCIQITEVKTDPIPNGNGIVTMFPQWVGQSGFVNKDGASEFSIDFIGHESTNNKN